MRLLSSQLISIKPLTLVINMASDEVVYNEKSTQRDANTARWP